MKPSLVISAVVAGVALIGWWGYARFYAGPMKRLTTELQRLEKDNSSFETALAEAPRVRAELKQRARGAMAGPADQVDHELRVGVRRIAEVAGLRNVLVTTLEPTWPANPYTRARKVRSNAIRTTLRGQRDFGVLRAELRGEGTLEVVCRTLALVQGQPWVQRVRSVRIEPKSEDRKVLEVRIGLAALYMPDFGTPALGEIVRSDEQLASAWGPMAAKNMFRYEPPVVAVRPDPPPQIVQEPPRTPEAPPPPPYHQWRVTSIILRDVSPGMRAVEVGVVNAAAGAALTLGLGDTVLGATLVSAAADAATFRIEEEVFSVALGHDLSQRTPVNPVH